MAIRIFLTERVSIVTDRASVDEDGFPGRQGRFVFAYLVAEHDRPVPRDELAEALWQGELPTTWVKALAVLVSKLRTTLEECGVDGIAITNAFGCYKLMLPDGAWVDVVAAAEAVEHAERALADGEPGAARSAAANAIELARRRFLPGEDGPWIEEVRRDRQRLQLRALECHADAAVGAGHAAEAVRSAEHIVELEPFRESGHRRLMQAHVAAGSSAEALAVYERCRRLLADELGAYPSAEVESLHREILRAPTGTASPVGHASSSARHESDAVDSGVVDPRLEDEPASAPRSSLVRRGLLVGASAVGIAVAIAVLVALAGGDGAEPEARAIAGAWTAIDQDGSNQTMEMTRRAGGDSYDFTFADDDAQACGGGPVTGKGAGTHVGDTFSGTISLTCASGAKLEFPYPLTYRAADDTIVDPVGVVWSRRSGE